MMKLYTLVWRVLNKETYGLGVVIPYNGIDPDKFSYVDWQYVKNGHTTGIKQVEDNKNLTPLTLEEELKLDVNSYNWASSIIQFYQSRNNAPIKDQTNNEKQEVKKMNETINVEKLIKEFEGMAERGTLLARGGVTQQDLLMQILGTIVKVSMDEKREDK